MTNIAVLVLAAGKSSRMKSVKQILKINTTTLLESILTTAKQVVPESVFCVLGANFELIKSQTNTTNIKLIYNENYDLGLGSSIVKGVKCIQKSTINFETVLILLADQPEVNVSFLNQLLELHKIHKTKIIATTYQKNLGVPAIFPKVYFNQLVQLKGDVGAKKIILQHKENVITFKIKKPLIDIDTPKDYLNFLNP